MGKIKNFLSSWLNEELWELLILLLVAAVVSIGVQSLLFWIGGLFLSIKDCGMLIDTILGILLISPLFLGAGLTEGEGNGSIFVGSLAIMGIYISVVWYFHAGILAGCLVLLYMALWRLYKIIGADPLWTCGGTCAYLLYCIGAYFAMIFNGLEPVINIYGIVTLIVATIGVWVIPASE